MQGVQGAQQRVYVLTVLEWFADNCGNILVILIVLGIVVLAVITLVRNKKKGKSSCGCGCESCAFADKCKDRK